MAKQEIPGAKHDVFDVAHYILSEMGAMSTWKLQKLVYYSQAWSLAWDDKPLFDERIEAWANGPVCPALYKKHRGLYKIEKQDLPERNAAIFDDDERETIDVIIRDYGKYEAWQLREMTHTEEPWMNARVGLDDLDRGNREIPKEAMQSYYGSL